MWLPTSIYEKTPQLWLLMALLFVLLGLYIGFTYPLTWFYVLLGIVCGVRGIHVWRMRSNFRRSAQDEAEDRDEVLTDPVAN